MISKAYRVAAIVVVFAFSFGVLLPVANCKTMLYISLNGNDSWSGKLAQPNPQASDGPLRTLEGARAAIRTTKQAGPLPHGGVTVYLRGGIYHITKTFELSDEDGGTDAAPIVYRAHGSEQVRLIGGKEISGFGPIADETVRKRIDAKCRDKIQQVDLKAQGVTDFGRLTPRGFGRRTYPAALELFFDGKPMQLARWPNRGWANTASVPAGPQGGKFTYEDDRPQRWAKADDIWLHGYWTQDWADSYVSVKSIDTDAREIVTREPHGVYGYKAGKRYYALNLLEELDEPGEWYLDRTSGMLYFWPPKPLADGEVFVSILQEPVISLKNAAHITLQGLTIEFVRGNAIEIAGGNNNAIVGCSLCNIGNVAVTIDGGTRNGVRGCEIYEAGDGGIRLAGGDRKMLTPAENYALNNHIHHYSRWVRTYRPAIGVSGVGNRAAHNLIHDGPHTAMLFGGNEHLLEFNEVYDVCRETGDVGAFYTGRDWTTRGSVIRHNYFHDIHGPYTHGAMAVYLDDAASGTTIFGNIFYRASHAVFIGGGRDNVVENNVFVECDPAVHIDARGLGWAKKHIAKGGGWHMYRKLQAVNFDKPPYSRRYPKLATILQDDPAVPKGNVVMRNICSGGRWLELQGVDRELVTMKDNLVKGDPGFVNRAGLDFRLKPGSAAHALGFEPIPVDEIGLTADLASCLENEQ